MIFKPSLFRSLRTFSSMRMNYSNKVPKELVFFMDNMAVCWHPEQKFPYECSKPLPKPRPELDSVLRISEKEAYKVFRPPEKPGIIADQLARETHTTKHIWFPRARDKKAKKTKPDRPYL